MDNPRHPLSDSQERLLSTFRTRLGEEAVGKRFGYTRHSKGFFFTEGGTRIAVDIADKDLVCLGRLGYLLIYSIPHEVVFTKKASEKSPKDAEQTTLIIKEQSKEQFREHNRVVWLDLIQAYAWLVLSVVAGLAFIGLLVLLIYWLAVHDSSANLLFGSLDVLSAALATVFFKQWDRANQNLNYMRSKQAVDKEKRTDQ